MRRIWTGLLAMLLMMGCSGEPTAIEAREQQQGEQEIQAEGLTLEMERMVYDPSLTRYTYFIHNDRQEAVELGEPYIIQRQEGGKWTDLTFLENAGFNTVGYVLEPGNTLALTCGFGCYEEIPEAGNYRLVKEVGGQTLYAEFALGESAYTSERPYGFVPLEELPEDYTVQAAAEDGCMVLGSEGAENLEGLAAFLEKAALGVPCQLRLLRRADEGAVLLEDVIYENDSFLWRRDDSRGGSAGADIRQERFSYLVTDGEGIYLSNGADWENTQRYSSATALLLEGGEGEGLIPGMEALTARRLEGNTTRYRLWSPDGEWDACLLENPAEFSIGWQKPGEGSWGSTYNLQDWDGPETEILGVRWLEDGKLELECGTTWVNDDAIACGASILTFDPKTETLI